MGMKLDERIDRIRRDVENLSSQFAELEERGDSIASELDFQTVFDQIMALHSANAHCIEECLAELDDERRAFEKGKLRRMIKQANKNKVNLVKLAEKHQELIHKIREKNK